MAVGFPLKTTYANGDVYSASDVNDTNGTVNLLTSSTLSSSAGKNAIINGGMDIWQRGTSISATASSQPYVSDRWQILTNANQASTISRQTTSDTTNLPSIQYCLQFQRNSGQTGTGSLGLGQSFETVNSIPLAGKTVTLSFYARRGANYSATSNALIAYIVTGTGTDQNRIIGSYTGDSTSINTTVTLTTTWQRFTLTGTLPTTTTEIAPYFIYNPTGTAGAADYYEITGVQLELGSTATTFGRCGSSLGGELALCQRYYFRQGGDNVYQRYAESIAGSTTRAYCDVKQAVTMRIPPNVIDYSTLAIFNGTSIVTVTSATINAASKDLTTVDANVASGLVIGTPWQLIANNSTSSYIGLGAEL
jgi:hypothetical protein